MLVGANRDMDSDNGLDGYLKGWIKRQTANYVAVVLERAGVLELSLGNAPPGSDSPIAGQLEAWTNRSCLPESSEAFRRR